MPRRTAACEGWGCPSCRSRWGWVGLHGGTVCVCVCVCKGERARGSCCRPARPLGGIALTLLRLQAQRGVPGTFLPLRPRRCAEVYPCTSWGGRGVGGVPRLPFGLGAFPCLVLGPQSLCRAVMSAAALPAPAGAIRMCGWGKDRYQQQSHLPPAFVSRPLPCVMASPPDPLAGLLLPVRKLLDEMGRKQVFFWGGSTHCGGQPLAAQGAAAHSPTMEALGVGPKSM